VLRALRPPARGCWPPAPSSPSGGMRRAPSQRRHGSTRGQSTRSREQAGLAPVRVQGRDVPRQLKPFSSNPTDHGSRSRLHARTAAPTGSTGTRSVAIARLQDRAAGIPEGADSRPG
jgi:hypothetical protein